MRTLATSSGPPSWAPDGRGRGVVRVFRVIAPTAIIFSSQPSSGVRAGKLVPRPSSPTPHEGRGCPKVVRRRCAGSSWRPHSRGPSRFHNLHSWNRAALRAHRPDRGWSTSGSTCWLAARRRRRFATSVPAQGASPGAGGEVDQREQWARKSGGVGVRFGEDEVEGGLISCDPGKHQGRRGVSWSGRGRSIGRWTTSIRMTSPRADFERSGSTPGSSASGPTGTSDSSPGRSSISALVLLGASPPGNWSM